jgi:flagellar basal body-associated protein FliL
MKFLSNKKNIITIIFLITIIIISHVFVFYITPFINTPKTAVKPFPFYEEFTVSATLLNTDGTPKLDTKNQPQTFQLDICGNDVNVQREFKNRMDSYVKDTINTNVIPTLSILNNSITNYAQNK